MHYKVPAADFFILQAAPNPGRCGVTDSSINLQSALRERNVACEILSLCDSSEMAMGFHRIASADQLRYLRGTIVLQVSLYGYQPRGIPFTLLRGLRDFASVPGNVLVAYFHETWASASSPLKSAFWLTWPQRFLCRRILGLSRLALFSTPITYAWGESVVGTERAAFCPTFSNVGEPEQVFPWKDRDRTLVIFGSLRTRPACYAKPDILASFIDSAGINEIIDIGPPMDEKLLKHIEHLPVRSLGTLPALDVSRYLNEARFGVFSTPWGFSSKSGVFAALQAHGVVPVSVHDLPDFAYQGEPGPLLNRDFVRLSDSLCLPEEQLAKLSASIHMRYRDRGVAATAERIKSVSVGAAE